MVTPGNFPVFMDTLVLVSIFLAIALSVFGFVMLLKYRHFGNDKAELLDQKLNSVNRALDSCEKMIDELNKLSDYIISNVEQKSSELKGIIDTADEKISAINNIQTQPHFEAVLKPETPATAENTEVNPLIKLSGRFRKNTAELHKKEMTISEENIVVTPKAAANAYKANADLINPPKEEEPPKYIVDTVVIDENNQGRDRGKMYAFVVSSKAKDVIELSKQGLNTTEIAKRLGIGKGEIELILGIKK